MDSADEWAAWGGGRCSRTSNVCGGGGRRSDGLTRHKACTNVLLLLLLLLLLLQPTSGSAVKRLKNAGLP